MKGYVPFRGKFIRVSDVPRGRPIVRTAEEWHKRGLDCQDAWAWWTLMLLVAAVTFITVMVTAVLVFGEFNRFAWTYAAFYSVFYTLTTYASERYHSNREVRRETYTGMFEHGLQIRVFETSVYLFLPYCEMTGMRLREGLFRWFVEVDIRGFKKPLKIYNLVKHMGDNGYAELLRRVGTSTPMPELPRLHVYGGPYTTRMGSPLHTEVGPRSYDFSAPLRF